jgi:hypothetical protein
VRTNEKKGDKGFGLYKVILVTLVIMCIGFIGFKISRKTQEKSSRRNDGQGIGLLGMDRVGRMAVDDEGKDARSRKKYE